MGNMGQRDGEQSKGRHFTRTGQGEMEGGMGYGVSAILYAPCHKHSLLE